jgi:hypothetical protein
MKVTDASKLTRVEIINAVGDLPTRKHHAAALVIETLRLAIESWKDGDL